MRKSKLLRISWLVLLVFSLSMCYPALSTRAQTQPPVVVLSPGHGWWTGAQVDPGAVSGDLVEKDLNLAVAQAAAGYLQRCPVEVHLTRSGDDKEHTLYGVDEIVNAYQPDLGVSIHTNSGSASGPEGWYTVGGYDDAASRQLAGRLSAAIAGDLELGDLGVKPETSNRHGGLYIHHWQAPSALVEIAYLQKDAELLRNEQASFGRAVARAVLQQLGIAPACASRAVGEGLAIAVFFPGERSAQEITLRNDGLLPWTIEQHSLAHISGPGAAGGSLVLEKTVKPGESYTWSLSLQAPEAPGLHRSVWQLQSADQPIEAPLTVYLLVLPEEAQELRRQIEQQIEDFRRQGEQELERFLQRLEQQIRDWAVRELPGMICPNQGLLVGVGVAAGLVWWGRKGK